MAAPKSVVMPAVVDDLGLSVRAFRVYAHLCRRAGGTGRCWPSGPSIAAVCKINRDTVWESLAELETAGLIRRRRGAKNVNVYEIVPLERVTPSFPPTLPRQPAETEGRQSPPTFRRESAESEGCNGNRKGDYNEGVGAASLPLTHEFPAFLPEVQAAFPGKDCAACWPEFVAHHAKRPEKLVRSFFEKWVAAERVHVRKSLRTSAPEVIAPKGWRERLRALPPDDWRRDWAEREWESLPDALKAGACLREISK